MDNGLMSVAEMKEHEWVVSWSGGKDSTATIILMHENEIPIKRIIYVRMMFDDELPATLPTMTKFVDRAKITLEEWGYEVEIAKSVNTAVEIAEKRYIKSKFSGRNGKQYGISAFCRGSCWFTKTKIKTIKSLQREIDEYEMIGYASDETSRTHRLGGKKQSVMVALGINEEETFGICRAYDLLSPLYDTWIGRDGCFFCPNAAKRERERDSARNTRSLYRESTA